MPKQKAPQSRSELTELFKQLFGGLASPSQGAGGTAGTLMENRNRGGGALRAVDAMETGNMTDQDVGYFETASGVRGDFESEDDSKSKSLRRRLLEAMFGSDTPDDPR